MQRLSRVTSLFIRGEESIRLSHLDTKLSVTAEGPGQNQRIFTFGDQATADEFLRLYEQNLIDDGWVLQAVVDRRSGRGSVPTDGDRRRAVAVAH